MSYSQGHSEQGLREFPGVTCLATPTKIALPIWHIQHRHLWSLPHCTSLIRVRQVDNGNLLAATLPVLGCTLDGSLEACSLPGCH